MVIRRATTKLGCLAWLVVMGGIGYFGVTLGKHYWRFVEFRNAMETEAQYASHRTDDNIRARLQALVDSLGLPASARNISVRRTSTFILISTHYYIGIELPGFVKEIEFAPKALGPL
jgi:hypothetical protein